MSRKLSFILVSFSLVVGLAGCKSASKVDEMGGSDSGAMTEGDANVMGDSDSGKAMGLQTIFFKYDSFDISGDGRAALDTNVGILKANPSLKVQVEGHCDARGGIQYNIALGEKRANAVRDAMKKAGIASDRVATISYGKERLLDTSMSDDAHAKNRRGNFVITSK